MTDDLKPCPFCGEIDTIIRNGTVEDDWCAVSCEKCYSQGPHQYTDPHAIADWNRRAALPRPEDAARIAALSADAEAARKRVRELVEGYERLVNAACAVSSQFWRDSAAAQDVLPQGYIEEMDEALKALKGRGP